MKVSHAFFLFALFFTTYGVKAQNTSTVLDSTKMEWFEDAKLGIFIHWGIYSVKGISESWSFFNNYVNHETYLKQLDGFTATHYKPTDWVELVKKSGARYSVITSKHHDGVALWDSQAPGAMTTVKHAAAGKDLLTPFVHELRKSGLRVGIYFSLPDWSYPDYDVFTRERKRYGVNEEPHRWGAFLEYYHQQLDELSSQYNPDLLWFDGDWEHSDEEWEADKVMANLRTYNPRIIVNSRLGEYGDYDTPEQGIPVVKPASTYWELCYTMNDSWGYQPYDRHYKSANMIIRTLVDCISMGGNLLLDIGPKPDGTIPAEQVAILEALGRWTDKHAEAIYGTRAGIPEGHFSGKTALSKDGETLYLYLNQARNLISVKGLTSEVKGIRVIGSEGGGKNVYVQDAASGDLYFTLGDIEFDEDVTVVALDLAEKIQLSPVSQPVLSLDSILQADGLPQRRLAQLVAAIHRSQNPFLDSDLPVDGLGFRSGVADADTVVHEWIVKHAEALYQTQGGLPEGHYAGHSALSADKKTLYLFVEGIPTGPIALKGLKNKIQRTRIVGEGTMVEPEIYNKLYWSSVPGIVYIPVPKDRADRHITVVAVLLDGELDLYRERVGAIEHNM